MIHRKQLLNIIIWLVSFVGGLQETSAYLIKLSVSADLLVVLFHGFINVGVGETFDWDRWVRFQELIDLGIKGMYSFKWLPIVFMSFEPLTGMELQCYQIQTLYLIIKINLFIEQTC